MLIELITTGVVEEEGEVEGVEARGDCHVMKDEMIDFLDLVETGFVSGPLSPKVA